MSSRLGTLALLAIPVGLAVWSRGRRAVPPGQPPGQPPPGNGNGNGNGNGGTVPSGHQIPGGGQPWPPPAPGPVPSGSWLDTLAEQYSPHREQQILDAIAAGRGFYEWYNIASPGAATGPMAGYTMAVPVMADALKIEGVRVTGTQPTAQALSDREGWVQMTPYVAGLIWEQAHAKPTPTTYSPTTANTSQMIQASDAVDAKIAAVKAQRDAAQLTTLVGNPGKDWVLTRRFWSGGVHPTSGVPNDVAAANFGLFQSAWNPIQNVGLFHPLNHVDYSQVLRFMGPRVMLTAPDGSTSFHETLDVLTDPELAPFLTGAPGAAYGGRVAGEGALPGDRHPALPPAGIYA